jgi:TRAP-type C4-dicarboxylate transport system permease large subunit
MSNSAIVGIAALSMLGLLWLWGAGVKTGRKAEKKIKQVSRTGSVLGWGLLTAGLIVGVQWIVIRNTTDAGTIGAVLGVPALVAGMAIARLCVVTIGATGVETRSTRGDYR